MSVHQSELEGRETGQVSSGGVLTRACPTGHLAGRLDRPHETRGVGWPPTPPLVTAGARQGIYRGEFVSPWRQVNGSPAGNPPGPAA